MIKVAAHALCFSSPLGLIDSILEPFSDRVDASCLGILGLGQVDAPHGIMDAIDSLRGDSLCFNQTSKPSATSTTRCIPSTSVGAVDVMLLAGRVRYMVGLWQALLQMCRIAKSAVCERL